MKKIVYLLITLLFTLTIASCKKSKQITLSYDFEQIEIFVGDEIDVKPNITVGKKVKEYKLIYALSKNIAEIKENKLIALEEGTTFLTVTTDINDDAIANLKVVIKEKEVIIPTKEEYTIKFNVDGGVLEQTEIKFKEDEQVTLPVPTKDGYIFKGWYENEQLVTTVSNKNYNLKAVWEKELVEYKITYIAQGAKMPSNIVTKFTDGSSVVLPIPTKDGYIFKGWYEDEVLVETLENRNYILTAKWEKEDTGIYSIEYKNTARSSWYVKKITKRSELVEEFYSDLYKWAKLNGETRTYDEYKTEIITKIKNAEEIKLIDPTLKDNENTNGGTEYFLNTSMFYNKWIDFFNKIREVVLKKNVEEDIYYDAKACITRLNQYLNWTSAGQTLFMGHNASLLTCVVFVADARYEYKIGDTYELIPRVHELDLDFLGWYDNPEFSGEPITSILPTDKGDKVFYAKWEEEIMPEEVILNKVTEIMKFETYQLEWTFNPLDTTNKEVLFISSNKEVATIDSKTGLITAIKEGTTVITMKILADTSLDLRFEIEIYVPGQVTGSYDTTSYVAINDVIKLNAQLKGKGVSTLVWESEDESIAMVDQEGNVSGLKEGYTTIIAKDKENDEIKLEFIVTVVSQERSEALQLLLDSHNEKIYTEYELGIGSGTPTYYKDIYGSASKLLSNYSLEIDASRKDKETIAGTKDYYGAMESIEFITVHYTGNMTTGSDAEANANYFVEDNGVSIHYTTGNDGVFQCLPLNIGGFHAGDSGSYEVVGEFKWTPTGVKASIDDPLYPVFTISDDFYYEINGQKTSIEMAKPYDYKSRGTNHILNSDGTISSRENYTQSKFSNRTPESFINEQGLPFKVVNGEYDMGTTWWAYTQVYEGRICSTGGNKNSIGIESCVDQGSDLWYTWQITAKLVAKLMIDNQLDITRVRGHHFFTAKDCPQPMLENNLEIWWEFLELVEAEYKLATTFKGYTVTAVSNDPTYMRDNGRIRKQASEDICVAYTITISNGEETETITLGSILPGKYTR